MMFLHPAGRNEKAFPQWPQKCLFIFCAQSQEAISKIADHS
jgi:hypothetical protein